MDKPIKLTVFPLPDKNGFGVGVRSLSQSVAPVFVARGMTIPPERAGDIRLFVKGERLKFTITEEAAKEYVSRFYQLSVAEQLDKIGYRTFKVIPKPDLVIISVKYFKVMRGTEQITSTYDLKELAKYRKRPDIYYILQSITRTLQVNRPDYLNWKEQGRFIEVTAQAKGIKGIMRNVQDITKMKVKGSDRHQGYRTTTSVNFYKYK